jgi:hypothetical protein
LQLQNAHAQASNEEVIVREGKPMSLAQVFEVSALSLWFFSLTALRRLLCEVDVGWTGW